MKVFNVLKVIDTEKILESVNKKNIMPRFFVFFIGILLCAIAFNLFFSPENIVTTGMSGLSILISQLGFITPATFILIANAIIIIISIFALPKKHLIFNLMGAGFYSLFVYLTQDIDVYLKVNFDSKLLYVLTGSVLLGFGSGLVFKAGFSSGGTDILGSIVSRYTKQPIGKCLLVINTIIIAIGGVSLGITMVVYSLIINYISTVIIDKIVLGISDSKMLIIDTSKEEEIKHFIMDALHSGVTILKGKGGFTKDRRDLLMCIVSTSNYFLLKESIKEIDSGAFITVTDCYEVLGGTKKRRNIL